MNEVVRLEAGARTLPGGAVVLRDVDLVVQAGAAVSIVGRSGSGKSTLLAGLGLLLPFDSRTRYSLDGAAVAELSPVARARVRGRAIGFVLQNGGLIEHLSALQNVQVPLMHGGPVGLEAGRKRASAALEALDVGHLARRRPKQLSGGERQRVAVARALVVEPRLILADEPTGALDSTTGGIVLGEMLRAVRERGAALVLVTHDLEVAARTDRVLRLTDGTLRAWTSGVHR